jgi:hypothetical protein
MRAIIGVLVIAAAIGFCAGRLQAAPAGATQSQNFTPLERVAQRDNFHDGYLPTCSSGFFYACYFAADGGRHCGCWLGGDQPACPQGYRYECRANRYDPTGKPYCACW